MLSKNGNKSFFIEKIEIFKKWLSELGRHGNVNVDVNVATWLDGSQINFRKSRWVKVIQSFSGGGGEGAQKPSRGLNRVNDFTRVICRVGGGEVLR